MPIIVVNWEFYQPQESKPAKGGALSINSVAIVFDRWAKSIGGSVSILVREEVSVKGCPLK